MHNNNTTLIGHLTKDIELKYTTSGIAYVFFTLGVKRQFKNTQGEYESDFINCEAWRQGAEYLGKYAKKGSLIALDGNLTTSTYENDGRNIHSTKVSVNSVSILKNPTEEKTEKAKEERSVEIELPKYKQLDLSPDDLPFY